MQDLLLKHQQLWAHGVTEHCSGQLIYGRHDRTGEVRGAGASDGSEGEGLRGFQVAGGSRVGHAAPCKPRAEEVVDPGEVRDGMDVFARMLTERMQRRRQERWQHDQTSQEEKTANKPIDEPLARNN